MVLTANCVRAGRSNASSDSFPVYEQIGNTNGLSTFQLSLKHPPVVMNEDVAISMGVVYENRPDILYIAKQSDTLAPRIDDVVQHYGCHTSKPTQQTVSYHASSGTYVDAEDAFLISDAYNRKLVTQPAMEGQDGDVQTDPKDCICLVQPTDNHGLPPFAINPNQYQCGRNELGKAAYSLLMVFLHSRHLLEGLVQCKWRQPAADVMRLQNMILKAVRNIYSSMKSTRS